MTKRKCFTRVEEIGNAIEKLADALDPERTKPFGGDILDLLEWAERDVLEMRQQLTAAETGGQTMSTIEEREESAAPESEFVIPKEAIIESLRQQLAALTESYAKVTERVHMVGGYLDQIKDSQKQVTLLRDALRNLWNERTPDSLDEAGEALDAIKEK